MPIPNELAQKIAADASEYETRPECVEKEIEEHRTKLKALREERTELILDLRNAARRVREPILGDV